MARIVSIASVLGFWFALIGIVGAVASPLGYRLGVWDFAFALRKVLAFASVAGVLGFLLCLVALLASKSTGARLHAGVLLGLVLGGLLSAYMLWHLNKVRSVPMIHDISTDTDTPPEFVALAAARRASPNGLDYRGAQIAAQQRKAYPDVTTLHSPLALPALFARAETAARAAGWHIAAAQSQEGRIEATVTSAIYGFKDDIVIRIRPEQGGGGSTLDMRSMSRVGISDLGMNAKRIREFSARLGE